MTAVVIFIKNQEGRIECASCSQTVLSHLSERLDTESEGSEEHQPADCSPKSSPLVLSASNFQNVLAGGYETSLERLGRAVRESLREQVEK